MTTETPQCFRCKHLKTADSEKWTCESFPDGIPEEIILNEFKHTKSHPNDNGILFEKDEDSPF